MGRRSDYQAAREAIRRDDTPTRVPRLVMLFPVRAQDYGSGICPHKKPIRRGSRLVCSECHQSGFDDLIRAQVISPPSRTSEIRFRPKISKRARAAAALARNGLTHRQS